MKDLAIVITIAYFSLYGAIAIVDSAKQVQAEEITNFCELEDIFCYGEPISEVETPNIVQSYAPIRPVEKSTDRKQLLHKICSDKGFKDDFCEKDLWGIAMTESRGNCEAIGDLNLKDHAYGCFQIRAGLHKVSIEDAKNFEFSAKWTLERMQRYGYPVLRSLAIRRHNGFGQSTFAYLETVNSYAK